MAKNRIHINLVPQFEKLKLLEIGLCLAEVYNPELMHTWDDIAVGVGADLRNELGKIRGICSDCLRSVPDKTEGSLYVIAFREKPEESLEVESL